MKLWLPTMQNRRAALRVGLVGIAFISLVGCTTGPALREADPAFARKEVTYPTPEPPGTVIVDPGNSCSPSAHDASRVEPFSEPAVNRSEKFASLLRFSLIAPEPRHAHRRAQFP